MIVLGSSQIWAQEEQVSMGPAYGSQAYYSLKTGEVTTVANDAWDIAFTALGQRDAGIFINESAPFMGEPLKLFLSGTESWSDPVTSTEGFVDSMMISNTEESWAEGAFNSVKDPSWVLDYGWGSYNPVSHKLEGTRIFVVKKRDGSFIKLFIEELDNNEYKFRFSDLNGENEWSTYVSKSDAQGGFVYYSFTTKDKVDMPTDYDLIFQRYNTPVTLAPNQTTSYIVSGVLLANGTEAVVAKDVDPSSVKEADYRDKYAPRPNTIGYDWKSFSQTGGWILDAKRTQFVKTRNGEIYQITFKGFSGASTGTTTFDKVLVGTVSTKDINAELEMLTVYPNPASDYIIISTQDQEECVATVFDAQGRKLIQWTTRTNQEIPVSELNAGMYTLVIETEKGTHSKRFIIQK